MGMIHHEAWYREASFDLLGFLRTQLTSMILSWAQKRKQGSMGFAALLGLLAASFVGISFAMRESAKPDAKRYHDTKLGRVYEFSLCILWGLQPPWLERAWRGYCHYQDLNDDKKSYAWHFKGNMKQAWDIVTGKDTWGPDLSNLVIREIEPSNTCETDVEE